MKFISFEAPSPINVATRYQRPKYDHMPLQTRKSYTLNI